MPNHLTSDLSGISPDELLQCWNWLVPPLHTPILVSALGDLFLRSPEGSVLWLDAGAGRISVVASSYEQFVAALDDPERQAEWFDPALVTELRQRLGPLPAGQCYSFNLPPTLSGSYDDPDNYYLCGLVLHFAVLGQIQEGVLDLPEGTVITRFIDVSPKP